MYTLVQDPRAYWLPSTGTAPGMAHGFNVLTTGTVSHPTLSNTNVQTSSRRTQWASGGAANDVGGLRSAEALCWRGNAARKGGFQFMARFSLPSNIFGTRAFVGLSASSTNICADDPSRAANTIGMGYDKDDPTTGTWFLITRDGTSGQRIPLPAALRSTTDVWVIVLRAAPNWPSVYVRIHNVSTGAVVYGAAVSSSLPDPGTLLYMHAQAGRGPSSGTATMFQLMQLDVELDLDPVVEGGVYDVRYFGAAGDGVTNDLPAFNAAIAAMSAVVPPNDVGWGGTLVVPSGKYLLSDDLHITRQLLLRGVTGGNEFGKAQLLFAAGKGLVVDGLTTSPDGGHGAGSVIRDLDVLGTDLALPGWLGNTAYGLGTRVKPKTLVTGYHYECTVAGTSGGTEPAWPEPHEPGLTIVDGSVTWTCRVAAGIWLRAKATIEHVAIKGFTNSGIHIQASTSYTPSTNANCFYLADVFILECNGHGVLVEGADSNSGVGIGIAVSACAGYGIWDSSFLGCTWISPNVQLTTRGSFRLDGGAQRSVIIGAYAEDDTPEGIVVAPSMVVGGIAPFSASGSGLQLRGEWANTLKVFDQSDAAMPYYAWLGMSDGTRSALGMQLPLSEDHPSGLRWQYDLTTRRWRWVWANSNNYVAMAISAGKGLPGPGVVCMPKLVLGAPGSTAERAITFAAAQPTTGFWTKGDRIYKANPDPNTPEGWVCTTSGGWAPAWAPGTGKFIGDVVQANGRIYQAIRYEGVATYPGQTGPLPDPTAGWTTTVGVEVAPADNQIVWLCAGVTPPVFKTFGNIAP